MADELDVHKSTVSRTVRSARYEQVRKGEEAARTLLQTLAEHSA